ncbi:MAG: PAS domain S-box-containing protein [Marivirga sp.]
MKLSKIHLFYAISIVAAIVVLLAAAQWQIKAKERDSEMINVAGRQRMLSQKIAKSILLKKPDSVILKSLQEWSDAQTVLLQFVAAEGLDDIYKQLELEYVIIENIRGDYKASSVNAFETFLPLMEETVKALEVNSNKKLSNLSMLQYGITTLIVLIIIGEFILIFFPASSKLEKQIGALSSASNFNTILIKDSPAAIALVDKELKYLSKSANWDLLFETDGQDSLVSSSLFTAKKWDSILQNCLKGESFREEVKNKLAVEKWITLDISSWKTDDDLGGLILYAQDITASKVLESNLQNTNEQLRAILNSAYVSIIVSNKEGLITHFSKGAENLLGYTADEMVGKNSPDIVHDPEELQARSKELSSIYKSKIAGFKTFTEIPDRDGFESKDWTYIKKNGQRFPVQLVVSVLKDKNNNAYGYLGIATDITEDVEIRKKALKSQEQYKLLAENTNDMVGLHKLDGTYSYVSPASKLILGYLPEELVGKTPYDFFHPDDIERIIKTGHNPVADENQAIKIEFRFLGKNGHYIWLETLSKLIVSNDKAVSIITSSRDITERIEIQHELAENYKSLEQAKKQAEQASNAKKQFLATMSHEIRTSLNAINGLSHILMLENPRADQIENLRLLNFSGEILLALINDILDISKIESGKIKLSLRPFDLRYLLTNIQKSLASRAQENKVDLSFNYDALLPDIFVGDSTRISQIIYNLVGNAIKFTESGHVTINTSLINKSGTTYTFRVGVRDNGIGISEENQSKIFDSFEQEDASISRKFGGTGLGLYISRMLLEIMGSEIKLVSSKAKGSYFYFDIKLKKGNLAKANMSDPSSKTHDFSDKHIHILVVEDNLVNQMIIGRFMNLYNVGFDFAGDGQQALDKIKSKAYNIVLMDLQMPIMDGFRATKEIRNIKDEYYQKIPIIALTADAFQDVKDKSLSTGMNDYLSKPFRPDDLVNIINKYYHKIGHLKISNKSSSAETTIHNALAEKTKTLSAIATILDKESNGDFDFKLEFAKRCKQNFIDFQKDFNACIINHDLERLWQSHHKLKTIMKIFELHFLSDKIGVLLENKNHLLDDQEFIKEITEQLKQIITDFDETLKNHE